MNIETKQVGLIVVTYNRMEKLKKNIQCLLKLNTIAGFTYNIYIVDNNSSDGTGEFVSKIQEVNYIRLNYNAGGAGGFYYGIQRCMEDQMDLIWGMDDDAFPQKDALRNLILEYIKCSDRCYWSNCNNDTLFDETGLKKTDVWMFVGFFLDSKMVKEIGYPRKDFFIYHDDAEYAYRLQKKGYDIIKVKNSIIIHEDSFSKNIVTNKIFNKKINYYNIPKWKCYYLIRNELLMWNYFEPRFWQVLYKNLKYLIICVLFNKRQILVVAKAIYHGVIRKSGDVMHP